MLVSALAISSVFLTLTNLGSNPRRIDLASLPQRTRQIRDPHYGRAIRLTGPTLGDLLEAAPPGPGADQMLLRCTDGFMVALPLERKGGLLAISASGGRLPPLDGGLDPGPVYLVWSEGVDREDWAFQVIAIDYVKASDYWRGLLADGSAPAAAQRGATLFRDSCAHCHALAGMGGKVGWDLQAPVPLMRYRTPEYVRAYVKDPRAVVPSAHMPKLPLDDGKREAIVRYLQWRARK